MASCEVCGAMVVELRRNRCWGCYSKWAASRPVGLGASCVMCGERRRECLKQVELLRAWLPMCHNCGARTAEMSPLPSTVDEIRQRLHRERRRKDRRIGRPDTRVFPRERRGSAGDRRDGVSVDEIFYQVEDDDIILVLDEHELELIGEETSIAPFPTR
jgi:hypothetical protein